MTPKELEDLKEALGERRMLFCHEYVKDFNGRRAAEAAGYSKKTARSIASGLLTEPNVAAYLAVVQEERFKEADLSAAQVLKEIAKLAFQSPLDIVMMDDEGQIKLKPFNEMKNHEAIKEIRVTQMKDDNGLEYGSVSDIKMHDKVKPLELLGRHLSLFVDKVDLSSSDESMKPKTTVIINHRRAGDEIIDS